MQFCVGFWLAIFTLTAKRSTKHDDDELWWIFVEKKKEFAIRSWDEIIMKYNYLVQLAKVACLDSLYTFTNSSKTFEADTYSRWIIDQSYKANSNRAKKTKTDFFLSTLANLQQQLFWGIKLVVVSCNVSKTGLVNYTPKYSLFHNKLGSNHGSTFCIFCKKKNLSMSMHLIMWFYIPLIHPLIP